MKGVFPDNYKYCFLNCGTLTAPLTIPAGGATAPSTEIG